MVEEGDLDDKLEDKATNEVVDDVKKVAMEGVDKERKQVAMKVANTNCLDDLIDDALLLLFLLLDCRICIKRRCNSQTCCACARRDLDRPEKKQHIFLDDLLRWGSRHCARTGIDVARWSRNITHMINNSDMFHSEGKNIWLEYTLDD